MAAFSSRFKKLILADSVETWTGIVLVFFLDGAVVVVVDRAEVGVDDDHAGRVNDGADTFSKELR